MALSFTPLTTLSTPPSKTDPANFTTRADTFLGELPDFQTEINTVITELNKITSGLDSASPIAAWAVGTTYDFPDLVAGSDGYTYRCVDTAVVGEDPTTDNGTHWIRIAEAPLGNPASDGMVLASTAAGVRSWQYAGIGVTPSGATLYGGISGFDISKTGANQITVSTGFALDSTGSIPLSLATATAATIPAVANTIYHVFVVRLVADSSFTVKVYTTESGVESDATVDHWRWVGFWRTNGSSECVVAYCKDGFMSFGKASESIIATLTTSYATVDHSSFLPESRVRLIFYSGVGSSSDGELMSSLDGVNVEARLGTNYLAGGDTAASAWGGVSSPATLELPFLASRQFKTNIAGAKIATHTVELRR